MIFNTMFNVDVCESIFNLILNIDSTPGSTEYCDILKLEKLNIDIVTFKRLKFYNILDNIRSILRPFYLDKYKYYIDRNIGYNEFLTIIRQLCKFMNVPYLIEIKYLLNEKVIFYELNIKDYCECIKNKLPINVSDSNICCGLNLANH
jgi:hypothetical protein